MEEPELFCPELHRNPAETKHKKHHSKKKSFKLNLALQSHAAPLKICIMYDTRAIRIFSLYSVQERHLMSISLTDSSPKYSSYNPKYSVCCCFLKYSVSMLVVMEHACSDVDMLPCIQPFSSNCTSFLTWLLHIFIQPKHHHELWPLLHLAFGAYLLPSRSPAAGAVPLFTLSLVHCCLHMFLS